MISSGGKIIPAHWFREQISVSINRNLSSFNVPVEDLVDIHKLYIRSVTEQSSDVWSSSITSGEKAALVKTEKSALRAIFKE